MEERRKKPQKKQRALQKGSTDPLAEVAPVGLVGRLAALVAVVLQQVEAVLRALQVDLPF